MYPYKAVPSRSASVGQNGCAALFSDVVLFLFQKADGYRKTTAEYKTLELCEAQFAPLSVLFCSSAAHYSREARLFA
jgi:hypothetical protein